MKLIPKNWTKFQHYKDRNPPWIKLHRDLLNDKEFMRLPLASKGLAPVLWLLASESVEGVFDADFDELEFRLRISQKELEVAIKPLIDNGFFLDASTMLAPCLQDAIPETETETETKRETKAKAKETTIPVDFYVTDKVIDWAQKNGYSNLQKHYDNFVLSCQARNYKYTNWDAAFMKAIRDNWAGVQAEKKNKVVL
jgi:hypothetical protein